MQNLLKNFGQSVRRLRKSIGATQLELSEELEISHRHLQNIEYGKVDLNISTILKIARKFDVSIDSFFFKQDVDPNALTYLDFLPTGIQVCNQNGLIIYSNQACLKYQGYSRSEQCMKMHIWDLLENEEEKDDLKKYLKYLIKERPRPTPYVSTNLTKSGERINVNCNWNYLLNEKKKVIGFITSISFQ